MYSHTLYKRFCASFNLIVRVTNFAIPGKWAFGGGGSGGKDPEYQVVLLYQ